MVKLFSKLNPIKKISIYKQLFLNYLFLFILLIVVLFFSVIYGIYRIEDSFGVYDEHAINELENIERYEPQKIYETLKLPEGSYIEILNSELIVISQYKSIHVTGYKYPYAVFRRLEVGDNFQYQTHYGDEEKEENIVLIYNPENIKNEEEALKVLKKILIRFILIFIVSIILVLLIYAKFTSRTMARPIMKILEGVKKISKGDYSTRIDYESKSELGYLINAINKMVQKIEEGIELRKKSESNRKRLILDISHDLKTPLTNILGYSETIRSVDDLNDELRNKYIDIVISNSKKANNLIQDLFELSHIESNDSNIVMENHDIGEFIRELLIGYVPELEENEMYFDFDIPEEEIIIKMNPQKLDRAISNIINNSIKYSGRHITLRLKLEEFRDKVVITIEDNGIGISEDLAEDIFEPFVRGDISRNSKTGGTGLGLGITKAIVEIHGGNIKLDSFYKDGCRFIIYLPK